MHYRLKLTGIRFLGRLSRVAFCGVPKQKTRRKREGSKRGSCGCTAEEEVRREDRGVWVGWGGALPAVALAA